ncbi:MAG: peptide deformylase [Clostridiales bacterium]|nr:peptide deformylase [Clostridiales bacterium]
MAVRNILKLGMDGDEILSKKCRPVGNITERMEILLEDLADTLYESGGVGLAAPQVGVLRRMAVIDVGDGLIELIDPEIIATEGEQTGTEGCLSYPDHWGIVTRPNKVTVRAMNGEGRIREITGEGLLARAFCHEIDHLDGHMFTEKVTEWIEPDEEEEE